MYSSRNARHHAYIEEYKYFSKTRGKAFLKRQCRRLARQKNKQLVKQEID
jgi:hypothetical protein